MSQLLPVGPVNEVVKRRRMVVEDDGNPIVVIVHEGALYALDDICIHKQRLLSNGVVLNGRVVCPGHQWSFQLGTGHEAVKDRCQPNYDVVVHDDHVYVDLSSRRGEERSYPVEVQAPVTPR